MIKTLEIAPYRPRTGDSYDGTVPAGCAGSNPEKRTPFRVLMPFLALAGTPIRGQWNDMLLPEGIRTRKGDDGRQEHITT